MAGTAAARRSCQHRAGRQGGGARPRLGRRGEVGTRGIARLPQRRGYTPAAAVPESKGKGVGRIEELTTSPFCRLDGEEEGPNVGIDVGGGASAKQ